MYGASVAKYNILQELTKYATRLRIIVPSPKMQVFI